MTLGEQTAPRLCWIARTSQQHPWQLKQSGLAKPSDRIYHGTARAPARTIAWAGDLATPLQQLLREVDRVVPALKQQQIKLAAAIPACKFARRTAPASGDTKTASKCVLPRLNGAEEEEE